MPASVPAIVETTVRTLDLNHLEVRWEIECTTEPLANFQFIVKRSLSSDGPFEVITAPLIDTFLLIDTGVNLISKYRTFFYVVRIERIQDTTDFHEGTPGRQLSQPDLRMLEIRRRHKLLLKRFVGTWCAVYTRKTFGQRCDCFEDKLRRVRRGNCLDCFTTGFVGGYMQQINQYVQMRPVPQVVQVPDLGEHEASKGDAWLEDFPLVRPRDLIVEPSNRRYRVSGVQTTQLRRSVSRQILTLTELDRKDIEFEVPFTEVEEPIDPFRGFYPKGTPGLWSTSPPKKAGSGLL